jgi:hypothetical protein
MEDEEELEASSDSDCASGGDELGYNIAQESSVANSVSFTDSKTS